MAGVDGDTVQAELQRALASLQGGDPAAAFSTLADILRVAPQSFDALNLAGVAATRLERYDEALDLLGRAIALRPEHAGAHSNLGIALQGLGRWDEALEAYRRVVDLMPDYAAGHANLGNAYAAVNRHEQAVACFDKSLALRPFHLATLLQLGKSRYQLGQVGKALTCFDSVLAVAPDDVDALLARNGCLIDLNRIDEALADCERALELDRDREGLLGMVLRQRMRLCDWRDFDSYVAEIATRLRQDELAIDPMSSMQVFDDPQLLLTAARPRKVPVVARPVARDAGDRIHLGYFSADYHNHVMARLTAGVLKRHDRQRFRLTAFGFNNPKEDEYTRAIRDLVDDFVLLDGLSDSEAAQLVRRHGIDVAIDLNGYTKFCRPGIFANRAAGVQVNYLGYPGTMGGDFMDYIIVDRTLVPPDATGGFAEKIVWMPDCYFPRDTTVPRPAARPARSANDLPDDAVVFSSFNQTTKILPDTFSDWMAILAGVDGSVLWLFVDNPGASANLRKEAAARGIDPNRLVFAGKRPQAEHIARLQLADLCLDTLPYNAHTTANDSLYAGVPMVTLPGRSFASRVCASMLTTVGLPELIATDRADFVRIAVELGRDREQLAAVKRRLAEAIETSPLYDMPRYIRGLERAYELMLDRHRQGLPPDHLPIELD